jgi:hybrid cluster-associated redox disulfide protein
MKNITKDSTLGEVMSIKGSTDVLMMHNVPCVSCPYARMEMDKLTIGEICSQYGIELEPLLKELNEIANKKKGK